jgi:hypothetical protein
MAMLMMIMNCLTSTGSTIFIKHLTNKDTLLVQKMNYKTSVNTPYKILSAVKERLQMYASSGVNQMWILKNSKELLESIKSLSFF